MKKLLYILLALILVLNTVACGSDKNPSTDFDGLMVGFGRLSILSDNNGVQIAGGDASARISDGYRDEVATTCIAIREGNETVLLYTVDLM